MTGPAFGLVLTEEQARRLSQLVTIADLAITEHHNTGWLPQQSDDARLMATYLKQLETGATLERPLTELRRWLTQQERNKR
jgi:hypothetical protein